MRSVRKRIYKDWMLFAIEYCDDEYIAGRGKSVIFMAVNGLRLMALKIFLDWAY